MTLISFVFLFAVADVFAWVVANGPAVLQIVLMVVGVFAAIATLTPNKSDNAVVDAIYRVINTLGLNVGKARNDPNTK